MKSTIKIFNNNSVPGAVVPIKGTSKHILSHPYNQAKSNNKINPPKNTYWNQPIKTADDKNSVDNIMVTINFIIMVNKHLHRHCIVKIVAMGYCFMSWDIAGFKPLGWGSTRDRVPPPFPLFKVLPGLNLWGGIKCVRRTQQERSAWFFEGAIEWWLFSTLLYILRGRRAT